MVVTYNIIPERVRRNIGKEKAKVKG